MLPVFMEFERGGDLSQISCSSGGVCCGLVVLVICSSRAATGLLFVGRLLNVSLAPTVVCFQKRNSSLVRSDCCDLVGPGDDAWVLSGCPLILLPLHQKGSISFHLRRMQ